MVVAEWNLFFTTYIKIFNQIKLKLQDLILKFGQFNVIVTIASRKLLCIGCTNNGVLVSRGIYAKNLVTVYFSVLYRFVLNC